MKRQMSYGDMIIGRGLLGKITTSEVIPRWEIAERKLVFKRALEAVDTVMELSEDMKMYQEKRIDIYRKHGVFVGGDGENSSFRVSAENIDGLRDELNKLDCEFSKTLGKEKRRQSDLSEILKKEADVDIEPIDYEWIGDFLDVNDVEKLMELELVNRPKEGSKDE
jgi:hypothetical protein